MMDFNNFINWRLINEGLINEVKKIVYLGHNTEKGTEFYIDGWIYLYDLGDGERRKLIRMLRSNPGGVCDVLNKKDYISKRRPDNYQDEKRSNDDKSGPQQLELF